MAVTITGNADPKEAQAYVEYLEKKHNRKLETLDVNIDGEYAATWSAPWITGTMLRPQRKQTASSIHSAAKAARWNSSASENKTAGSCMFRSRLT